MLHLIRALLLGLFVYLLVGLAWAAVALLGAAVLTAIVWRRSGEDVRHEMRNSAAGARLKDLRGEALGPRERWLLSRAPGDDFAGWRPDDDEVREFGRPDR